MMLTRMTMTKTFCAEWLSGSVVVVELGSVIDQCHECEGPGGQHNSTPTSTPSSRQVWADDMRRCWWWWQCHYITDGWEVKTSMMMRQKDWHTGVPHEYLGTLIESWIQKAQMSDNENFRNPVLKVRERSRISNHTDVSTACWLLPTTLSSQHKCKSISDRTSDFLNKEETKLQKKLNPAILDKRT